MKDKEGHWGIKLGSALVVQRVKVGNFFKIKRTMSDFFKGQKKKYQGNNWLEFKRLTQVPIQTRMVKASMLTKKEKNWVKVISEFLFKGSISIEFNRNTIPKMY